jgi:uncharacterized protein YfdQ (DUF2303 family)
MTETTAAAEVVRDLATQAAEPSRLDLDGYYVLALPGGRVETIDLTGDKYRAFPRRKTGIVTVRNVASFGRYYAKHADENSEVFADLDQGTVTAVLDAHRGRAADDGDADMGAGEGARWQQHRLVLALQLTQSWKDWTGHDRQLMGQQDFAEFLEEHARDIDPGGTVTAADLLEAAQHFQAKIKVAITSGKRLRDGQTQFEYMEQIESAGRPAPDRGTIEMPSEFDLAVKPYEDCDGQPVAVRVRFRIRDDKKLALGYFINDPARVAREAVAEVVAKLEAECGVTVMHGQPA